MLKPNVQIDMFTNIGPTILYARIRVKSILRAEDHLGFKTKYVAYVTCVHSGVPSPVPSACLERFEMNLESSCKGFVRCDVSRVYQCRSWLEQLVKPAELLLREQFRQHPKDSGYDGK